MATQNVDRAWTSVTARQNAEFWRLAGISGSHVNSKSFQLYLEGKNPFPIEKSQTKNNWVKSGYYIDLGEYITPNFSGQEWVCRLEKDGHEISDSIKEVAFRDDFREEYCYKPGTLLHLGIILGLKINSSGKTLIEIANVHFGPDSISNLKPELGFIIRDKLSNEDMREMSLRFIDILHSPILDPSDGHKRIFSSVDNGSQSFLIAPANNLEKKYFETSIGGIAVILPY